MALTTLLAMGSMLLMLRSPLRVGVVEQYRNKPILDGVPEKILRPEIMDEDESVVVRAGRPVNYLSTHAIVIFVVAWRVEVDARDGDLLSSDVAPLGMQGWVDRRRPQVNELGLERPPELAVGVRVCLRF